MAGKEIWKLFSATCREWASDKISTMGAALAYYAVFALAPLVVIAVWVAGLIFGEQAARGEVSRQLHSAIGPTVAQAIEDTLAYSQGSHSGFVATLVSIGLLIVAVLSLFTQLQDSLNTIWGVRARSGRGWWPMIRDRLASFLLMLFIGVLLVASLVASSVLAAFSKTLPLGELGKLGIWRLANWGVTFVLVTVLFAMIYRFLPDVRLHWRDVFVGAALTAILFTLGNYVIGLYLGRSGTASAYGAAGSLVSIMLWVYYSSQVLLFGAELTQVYATCYGQPFVKTEKADLVDPAERPRKKLAERCAETPQRSAA